MECTCKTLFYVASFKMSMGSFYFYAISPSYDAVSEISAKRFRQYCHCLFSKQYAPRGPISTWSDRISTTRCNSMSIRVHGNPFCHWELQAARVWRELKNMQQRYATFSVSCTKVPTQGPSVSNWISRYEMSDVLFYTYGCTLQWGFPEN